MLAKPLVCLTLLASLCLSATAKDPRTPVADTRTAPAKYVGRIVYSVPSGAKRADGTRVQAFGSGTLIGPRHVLTAAHVISNRTNARTTGRAGFPKDEDDIWFFPAVNGDINKLASLPWRPAKVVGIYMQKRFQDEDIRYSIGKIDTSTGTLDQIDQFRLNLDIAILLLDRDLSKEVGGVMPMATLSDADIRKYNPEFLGSGYDIDVDGGKQQLLRKGSIKSVRGTVLSERQQIDLWISDNLRVFGGASGGPLWINKDGIPTVVGLLNGEKGGTSRGVLLTPYYLDWANAYVKDTTSK